MRTLIVVDMQNDFITGSLANKEAEKIIPDMCKFIEEFEGNIIVTYDTHKDKEVYMLSNEGKNLPVHHCEFQSDGWKMNEDLFNVIKKKSNVVFINKPTFGSLNLTAGMDDSSKEDITLIGTCTDICVVSNALILKAQLPEAKISVVEKLCAGVTKESHDAAILTMSMCQVQII